jgi:hypothetical protein
MSVRRQRPPIEQAGTSIRLRLPDGTVKEMAVGEQHGPTSSRRCCFCGEPVADDETARVHLTASWLSEGSERARSWEAHRACLAERLHDSVPDAELREEPG